MLERHELSEARIKLEPKRVHPRHRALMRELIGGMTLSQAATYLGFTVSRASIIINSPLFQLEMKEMESELKREFISNQVNKTGDPVKAFLAEHAITAAKTLRGALNDENVGARISAAKDILDRTGYAKEDKVKTNVVVEPSQSLLDVLTRINVEHKSKPIDIECVQDCAPSELRSIDDVPLTEEKDEVHGHEPINESTETTTK
jgi:hypothetical protein